MGSQMLLLNELLPASALALGCLVESMKSPITNAYTPSAQLPEDAILPIPAKSFNTLLSSGSDTSFNLALTKLLKISHSLNKSENTALESMLVKRYMLKQPRALFRELCIEDSKARSWLESGIQAGRKSYLVVELQTAVDAAITRRNNHGHETKADVTVPVSTIATGGADVLGLGPTLDAGGGVGIGRKSSMEKSFSMEGENIFAIGYKKVTWKSWGFKRKLEKAVLSEDVTWSMLGQKRGREDQEEVISVDLTDDLVGDGAAKEDEDDFDEDFSEDEDEHLQGESVEVDGQVYHFSS